MSKKQARPSSTRDTKQKKVDLRKFFKRESRFVRFSLASALRRELKCEASEVDWLIEEASRLGYVLEAGTVGLFPGVQVYRLNPEKEPVLTL